MRKTQLLAPRSPDNVSVIGITTTLQSHKLAWCINQAASLRLTRAGTKGHKAPAHASEHLLYFLFETTYCTFRLVKNSLFSPEGDALGHLLPRFRQFDFFFTAQDATATFQHETLCGSLRAIPQVTYIAHLPTDKWDQSDLLSVLDN